MLMMIKFKLNNKISLLIRFLLINCFIINSINCDDEIIIDNNISELMNLTKINTELIQSDNNENNNILENIDVDYELEFINNINLRIEKLLNESRKLPVTIKIDHNYRFKEVIIAVKSKHYIAANQLYEEAKPAIILSVLINNIYDGHIENAEKLVNFFIHMNSLNDKYRAYRILYDLMIEYEQQYTTLTTTMVYQVIEILQSQQNIFTPNEDLRHFMLQIPKPYRYFDWSRPFYIRNYIEHNGLFSDIDKLYDTKRRIVYSKLPWDSTTNDNCKWKLMPKDNAFHMNIKNVLTKEYLYAETEYNLYANLHRRVFTWITKNNTENFNYETQKWQIEPTNHFGFFKIKNLYYNEYLYIENNIHFMNTTEYRPVFTRKSGPCMSDGCKWQILNVPKPKTEDAIKELYEFLEIFNY